jgi:uncharacterized membrane protein HdeD (DUF308 family)
MPVVESEVVVTGIAAPRPWAVALRGAAALLFAALAFTAPGITLLVLTFWVAAYLAVDGVFAIIAGARALAAHHHGAALVAEGLLGLAAAVLILAWPAAGIEGLVLLIAAWALLSGTALLWAAIALPLPSGRGLMGAAALLSIVLGVLLVAHPLAGAVVLAWWLGAYALASGVMLLALAWMLARG